MTRKALGRGLSALLSADNGAVSTEDGHEVEMDLIDPSPVQPRSRFDESKLNELAQSIRANGVVQPVLVRRQGARYELIAGERRWRAAELAGLTKIPAVVRDVSDDKMLELALIENIQREDLNPIEEAQAYKNLIDTIGLTQDTLAQRVGRDRSYIPNDIRLLRLPSDLQELVQEGKLSTGHARTLLGISEVEVQRKLARKIIEMALSVRQTERLIKDAGGASRVVKPRASLKENDANVRDAEAKLRRHLGTQVRILQNGQNGGGKIEVEFYSQPDLDRLFRMILARADRPALL